MTESKALKGKVADILSQYEIAINIGKSEGVEVGMRFIVLGEKSIIDPDNNQKLGTYNYEKLRVKVSKTEEHYSVAGSEPRETFSFGFDAFLSQPKVTREPLASNVTADKTVEVGDPVVQVEG